MIVDHKRKPNFQTYRVRSIYDCRSVREVVLIYTERSKGYPRIWHLPLEYGGKLAMTPPPMHTLRAVGIRAMGESTARLVAECIAHIEENGDPIQNDEHVFAGSV